MAQIIWTEAAWYYLNEIAEYIAIDKVESARRLVQQVFSSLDRLEHFPESGLITPELENTKYHEIIVGPCRIFYRIDANRVYILYVMRAERHLRKYMLDENAG